MKLTNVPRDFSSRYLNEGFSGGEKKRMEILQLALQKPGAGDPRRDRLRPRHRRPARRRQRRQRGRRPGHGRADHHPLPADPAPRAAEPRARHVPGAGSSRRAARSWSPSSRPRATAGSPKRSRSRRLMMSAMPTVARRRRRRVPGAAPGDRRASDRLPRLRRDLADAAAGDRRDDALLHRVAGLDPPRRLPARRRGDRPVRGRPAADRRLARLDARGDDLHRQRDRGDQPRRLHLGPAERRPRRPRGADRDGAPLEHRPLAAAVPGPRGRAGLRAGARRRPARPRRARPAARALAQARRRRPRLERARHDQPGRVDRQPRARCRRGGADRRRPGGPAAARRPARRSTPTSTPGPVTRPTGRPASACCTAAASCSRRCPRSSAAVT